MTDCPFDSASQTALLTLLTTLNDRQDTIATLLTALCNQQDSFNQSIFSLSDRLATLENQTIQSNAKTEQHLEQLTTQLNPLPTSLATLHDGMNQSVTYSRSLLIELRRFTRTKRPKRPAQSLQESLNSLQRMVKANTQGYLELLQQLQQPDPTLQQALQILQQAFTDQMHQLQTILQTPNSNLQQSLLMLTTTLESLHEQLNTQTQLMVSLTNSIEQWQNVNDSPPNQ